MAKRGNPRSNWSNWSDKGQHCEEQDRGSQHRSTQPRKHSSSSSAVQPAIQRQRHTAEQSGGGQHCSSQRWEGRDRGSQHRSSQHRSSERSFETAQKHPSSGSAAQSAIEPGHHTAAYCSSSGSAHSKAHRADGGKSIAARPAIGASQAETARAASEKHPSSGSAAQSAIRPGHHTAAYCSSSGSAHSKAHRADGGKSIAARPAIGAPQASSKRIELKPAPQRADRGRSSTAPPAIGASHDARTHRRPEQSAFDSSDADSKTHKADRGRSSAIQPAGDASRGDRTRKRPAQLVSDSSDADRKTRKHDGRRRKRRRRCRSDERPASDAAQPASDAAQPAAHVDNKTSSAERPASGAAQPASGVVDVPCKRIKPRIQLQDERFLTCVAYVKIPTFARFGAKNCHRLAAGRSVICTMKNIQERGGDIINIVFERAGDLVDLWRDHDMEKKTREMGFLSNKMENLLTLRRTSCGRLLVCENGSLHGWPAMMLHLQKGPHENLGDMIIVNAACPNHSQSLRTRMLDSYIGEGQKCDERLQHRNSVSLMGGDLGLPLFLEKHQESRDNGFHLSTADENQNTCISVFARTDDGIEHDCYQNNSREADITMVQLWKSATKVTDAQWTQETEVRKRATRYDSHGGHQMMEVCEKTTITAGPPPQCHQRRLAQANGSAEPVLLATNDPRRISYKNRLGARKEELLSVGDAPHQPQLEDVSRRNQLCDQQPTDGDPCRIVILPAASNKSIRKSSCRQQLTDGDASCRQQLTAGDSDSEKPPVEEHLRDSDSRTPDLKPNTPKWDNLVQKLSTVVNKAHVRELTEFLRTQCFRKPELLRRNANGDRLKFPMPLALKMEQLLDAAEERRRLALTQLKPGCDLALADATVEIPEEHMKRLWQLRLLRDVF